MKNEEIFLQKQDLDSTEDRFHIRKKEQPLPPLYQRTLHWHDFCELELILGGKGEHRLNGASYPVSRGDVYLLTPRDLHTLSEAEAAPVSLYNVSFDPSVLPAPLGESLLSAEEALLFRLEEEEVRAAEALMDRILTEQSSDAPYHIQLRRLLFAELIILLLRRRPSTPPLASKSVDPVRRTIVYLKEHFREPLTLSACAARVFLSPSYLGELFCRSTGVHFKQYLNRLRLEYALRLLHSTSLSVAEISREAGFSSPSYFISLFREQKGATPAEYRRRSEPATKKNHVRK